MAARKDYPVLQHIPRLDVLRALAFLSVFAFHLTARFAHTAVPWHGLFRDYSAWPRNIFFLFPLNFGWLGVALFYVLSGFCIHYATLRRRTPFTLRDFYWRRFLRIYPAYIVAVLVFSALAPWLPYHYFNVWQVVAHVLMVHNFLKATMFGIDGVLWSLAVEMQFYLLYPFLLHLARRWGGLDRCLVMSLALNVAFQIYFSFREQSFNPIRTTWGFPLMTWCCWILGACLADAHVHGRRLFPRGIPWLIFSGVMLVGVLNFKIACCQAFLFGSVFFTVLMQQYLLVRAPLFRVERMFLPVGLISYSLYLLHEPILMLVNAWGVRHHAFATPWQHAFFEIPVTTIILGLLSWASYYFLEVRAPAAIRDFAARRKLTAKPIPLPGPVLESPVREK
jgi:peptidoglycan/LPS O-acetylase OafA/YrhL